MNGWKTSAGKSVQNLDLWQKIDNLRIKGLNMEFVKGHSGDKNNERVDLIATNYSKGISIIKDGEKSTSQVNFLQERAPSNIAILFSRNELINKFAKTKYLLNSEELVELIGDENNESIKKFLTFEWRSWRIIPKDKKYWIIDIKMN